MYFHLHDQIQTCATAKSTQHHSQDKEIKMYFFNLINFKFNFKQLAYVLSAFNNWKRILESKSGLC